MLRKEYIDHWEDKLPNLSKAMKRYNLEKQLEGKRVRLKRKYNNYRKGQTGQMLSFTDIGLCFCPDGCEDFFAIDLRFVELIEDTKP